MMGPAPVPYWVIRELRMELRQYLKPGMPPGRCRICRRRVKLDKRKLDSIMARIICRIFKKAKGRRSRSVDYRDVMERGRMGECAILRHWGLVRPDLTQPSGHWFLTELGQDFVRGDVKVPFAIWHWNKKRYGATTRTISLRRALANTFDLDELLASVPEPSEMD